MKQSRQASAAQAIREELKKEFPGQTFSVTSKSFSMGDSVDIRWTNGPTADQVNAITKQYQYGHFDGMTDMYEHSNSRKDIPQSKYVQTSRTITPDKYDQYTKENYPNGVSKDQWGKYDVRDEAYRELRNVSYYERPTPVFNNERIQNRIDQLQANGNPTIIRNAIMKPNPAKGGIELYFSVKPLQTTIDDLKAAGWRWGKFKKCWYILDCPDARLFAEKYTGVTQDVTVEHDMEVGQTIEIDL